MQLTSIRIIRKFRVPEKLDISSATLALWLNPKSAYFDDSFPKEIQLSANVIGFYEAEIDAWLASRVKLKKQLTKVREGVSHD